MVEQRGGETADSLSALVVAPWRRSADAPACIKNVESPSGVAAESRGRTAESGARDEAEQLIPPLALDTCVGHGQRVKAQGHAKTAGGETLEPQTAAGFGG